LEERGSLSASFFIIPKVGDPMEEIVDQHKESAEELLDKYDKESQVRPNIGRWRWVVTILGIYLTLFHLYTGYFGILPSHKKGAIHLGTDTAIICLLFPPIKGLHRIQKTVPRYDVILASSTMYVTCHQDFFYLDF